jgi:hypothetical protein
LIQNGYGQINAHEVDGYKLELHNNEGINQEQQFSFFLQLTRLVPTKMAIELSYNQQKLTGCEQLSAGSISRRSSDGHL